MYILSHIATKLLYLQAESHLNETIFSSEIFPNNFQTYRKDRHSYGGGVFVSVKSSIPSSQIDINSSIEIVWSYIHLNKNSDVIVGSVYCPPHSVDTVLKDLQSCVVEIKQGYPSAQIILAGDFNCPGIDWEHSTLTDSYSVCTTALSGKTYYSNTRYPDVSTSHFSYQRH